MKLNKLKLRNFRSYSTEIEFFIDDLNVLIGRNDIGKSSILEALDIFFNGKPDKDDLTV
ncbi:AAA family ATPase [bacterium]|nr:AAA family ATPase [bacterium]